MLVVKGLERMGVSNLGSFDSLGFVELVTLSLGFFWFPVGQSAFPGRTF